MPDHYETLGVSKDASQGEIKKSYYKQAREHHPDKQTDPAKKSAAEEKFKGINEAYATLSDPDKRQAYDNTLKQQANQPQQGDNTPSQNSANNNTTAESNASSSTADTNQNSQYANTNPFYGNYSTPDTESFSSAIPTHEFMSAAFKSDFAPTPENSVFLGILLLKNLHYAMRTGDLELLQQTCQQIFAYRQYLYENDPLTLIHFDSALAKNIAPLYQSALDNQQEPAFFTKLLCVAFLVVDFLLEPLDLLNKTATSEHTESEKESLIAKVIKIFFVSSSNTDEKYDEYKERMHSQTKEPENVAQGNIRIPIPTMG
ncbi:MAG: DnaJ domain-containing protein [Pseudomonadota bacterium]